MDPNVQALLLAAIPVALSIYTLWSQRRKQQAEVDISLSEATMNIVKDLRTQLSAQDVKIATLMQRVSNLEAETLSLHRMNDRLRVILDDWRRGIRMLIEQLKALKAVPVWEPAKEDEEGIE